MENSNEKLNRFHRFPRLITVIMIGSLSILGACSDDDKDTGIVNGGGGVSAFNFTASNSILAAEIAAAAMDFFPAFNEIGLVMIDTLQSGDPLESPFADVIPCTNVGIGSTSLSWVDTDSSGDLTVGDTATLTFTACDLDFSGETISGTVAFEALSVSVLPPGMGFNVSINLTINLGADTTIVAGDFGFNSSTTDLTNFTNLYVAGDVPGQTITITENGVKYFEAGCFQVSQTYNIADVMLGNFGLAPRAVINAANQILSLNNDPPLTFVGGAMNAGTKRLLSVAKPECASIGVPGGVSNSDGSYMDMQATGGGLITLHTFDINNVEFFTDETTWDLLTD